MTLSVIAHLAIIMASVVGTTVAKPAPKHLEPRIVLLPPQPKTPETKPRQVVRASGSSTARVPSNIVIKHIDIPLVTPVGIPDVIIDKGEPTADSIVIGGGPGPKTGAHFGSLIGGGDAPSNEWRGNDAYMNLLKSATPRYPEPLRQAGVDGRVLIRFTVDTLGRIDPASVQVLAETHALFSRAVRDALSGFRFRPAESNGKKVPALAEMPFEFSLTKR
jgi:protein TonB